MRDNAGYLPRLVTSLLLCVVVAVCSILKGTLPPRYECVTAYGYVKRVDDSTHAKRACEQFSMTLASPRHREEHEMLKSIYRKDLYEEILYIDGISENNVGVFRNADGWLLDNPYNSDPQVTSENNRSCLSYFNETVAVIPCSASPVTRGLLNAFCETCIPKEKVNEVNVACACKNGIEMISYFGCNDTCLKIQASPTLARTVPCRPDRFGPDCVRQCHCKDDTPCDVNTGRCPGDCKPNWGGEQCNNTKCPLRTWGPSCENHCFCIQEQKCEVDTGTCLTQCEKGLLGLSCLISTCLPGTFGTNCSRRCHCKPGITCSGYDGRCMSRYGCLDSWATPFCNETLCPPGSYGPTCEQYCMCKYGEQCDVNTGLCPDGCEGSWTGRGCNQTRCDLGTYGPGCRSTCLCPAGMPCDEHTGECLGSMVPTFPMCEQPGVWGALCNKRCTDRNCLECLPNDGDLCQTCKSGYQVSEDNATCVLMDLPSRPYHYNAYVLSVTGLVMLAMYFTCHRRPLRDTCTTCTTDTDNDETDSDNEKTGQDRGDEAEEEEANQNDELDLLGF